MKSEPTEIKAMDLERDPSCWKEHPDPWWKVGPNKDPNLGDERFRREMDCVTGDIQYNPNIPTV
jgi:hypothetical protein